jgi:hypothetical protein
VELTLSFERLGTGATNAGVVDAELAEDDWAKVKRLHPSTKLNTTIAKRIDFMDTVSLEGRDSRLLLSRHRGSSERSVEILAGFAIR